MYKKTNYGLFAPKTIRSRERKFQVWNFRSLELSHPGTFAPWNFRTLEHIIIIIIIFYLPKTTIIATSQLYVNKRLPIGLPNIFGFVDTQRRVFLWLIVRLGAYKQARDRSVVSQLIRLISVEFYLYPTVSTVLIHSAKPELTE